VANSWQQPVSGEPSAGTLHLLYDDQVLGTGAPATWANVTTYDASSIVPVGAKAVLLALAARTNSGNATTVYVADSGGTTVYQRFQLEGSGAVFERFAWSALVPLDANRKFYLSKSTSDISAVRVDVVGYYI